VESRLSNAPVDVAGNASVGDDLLKATDSMITVIIAREIAESS
jgi:hypothetical protein